MARERDDCFINSQFHSPEGGVLTVKEDNGLKGSKKKYILECSVCSKDGELWPYGSIQTTKSGLLKGNISCNCSSGTTNWKEFQNKLRVERECTIKKIKFLGWSGKYKGWVTYLKLYNPDTGNTWESTTLDSLINRGTYDPSLRVANAHKYIKEKWSDENQIKSFIEGGYHKDTEFWRSNKTTKSGRHGYWFYSCPQCSDDEYVKKGLCTGIFEILDSSAKIGQKSCRCSPRYRWTEGQMKLKVSEVAVERGWKILSVEKRVLKGKKQPFTVRYVCDKGHEEEKLISNFFKDVGCPRCKRCGFNKNLQGFFYIVEWFGKGKSYIKFGITNRRVEVRIQEQAEKSKLQYKILTYFKGHGENVYNVESRLKNELNTKACPRSWLQDGYTETVNNTEENLMYIKNACVHLEEVEYV